MKGLTDRAHIRKERLVLIDQPKEGAESSDVGCRRIGYSSYILAVRAASVFVNDEPEVLY